MALPLYLASLVSKQYNLLLARAVLPAAGKVKRVVEITAGFVTHLRRSLQRDRD